MNLEESKVSKRKVDLGNGNYFEVEELEEYEKWRKNFDINEFWLDSIRLSPGNWIVHERYLKLAKSIYNFKFLPDDVMVMTYPKSGTTWMQELVWTMLHNPNLDHPLAKHAITDRSPMIEHDIYVREDDESYAEFNTFKTLFPDKDPLDGVFLQLCETTPSPRVLKNHLPFPFYSPDLLDKCKVVYVARNPYDTVVSCFHWVKVLKHYNFLGGFDEYLDAFMDGTQLVYDPYWSHIKEAWKRKSHPNLHFVFYEDLVQNNEEEIRKLDSFLGTKLNQQQIKNVISHTSFKNMKKIDMEGSRPALFENELLEGKGLFRKGKVGSWKETLTTVQREKLYTWIDENTKDCDIKMKYE